MYLRLYFIATVKQAFEDVDEKDQQEKTPDISDKHDSSLPNPSLDKIELNRSYEKSFFTFNNSTVEVILNNDIISWSTVLGGGLSHTSSFSINQNFDCFQIFMKILIRKKLRIKLLWTLLIYIVFML
jgi:hypothetical protein